MFPPLASEVLEFWIGNAADNSGSMQNAFKRWFQGGKALDAEIQQRFGVAVAAALAGEYTQWEESPRARLALVILLDQFPRNIHRGTALAFAGDARAVALSRRTVADNALRTITPLEQLFMLMPYQHVEYLPVQEEGLLQFRELAAADVPDFVSRFLQSSLEYAEQHRDIIARFGRFPYRNEVLGRDSTDEELEWLETGARFGQ